tara:strand:+ start:1929 stop:2363 length:435 start_codon:yes stop_codon:yes gene_type:complete
MTLLGTLITGLLRVIAVCSAFYFAFIGLQDFGDIRITATTLIALSGTLTGFIMTSLSMLVSTADRPFMINLRQTGHFQNLVNHLLGSAGMWVFVICLSFSVHLTNGSTQQIILSFSMAMMLYSLMYFLSAMHKFRLIIIQLARG